MGDLYEGDDGCDFDSCCPIYPAMRDENAALRKLEDAARIHFKQWGGYFSTEEAMQEALASLDKLREARR